MSEAVGWVRRQLPGIVALALVAGLFLVARLPGASAAELDEVSGRYAFTPMSIALPGGFAQQTIRRVNQDYRHIDAWISSVGAGIAMNDLDGDGLANDLCLTDPRIDQVVVTPTPGAGETRYRPFALESGRLPMNHAIAPMGCAPGDFNEDGRIDLLVYYWGRTPVVFLARPEAAGLSAAAYQPTEAVPGSGPGRYDGPQWNTNAVAIADFDGDGHDDIYVGNYFPHGPVLDHTVSGGVAMNRSLSNATNGGQDYILRWTGAAGATVSYELVADAVPARVAAGWVLAAGANDLDGDQLPELYVAQDHGRDALLHNRSTPGRIRLVPVEGVRSATEPKSKRIGGDSFKGMGIDFADLNRDGVYDMFVSNITTTFGIQESNLTLVSTVGNTRDLRTQLNGGKAPWQDRSTDLGTAWSGWAWDAKFADFDNSGEPAIVQTTGFLKGEVNRWPQLQELATANDLTLEHPEAWPRVVQGDDIAGSQRLAFFARAGDGRFLNVAEQLGLAVPVPTRGIATGDADGDGRIDFAVARQWAEPVFYRNESPTGGAYLGLRLTHDTAVSDGPLPAPGSPVVGTQITVTTPDGRRLIARVDGGSGHSGKRSHEVHIGLGDGTAGPVRVSLRWRDRTGEMHQDEVSLLPGWHSLRLGDTARER